MVCGTHSPFPSSRNGNSRSLRCSSQHSLALKVRLAWPSSQRHNIRLLAVNQQPATSFSAGAAAAGAVQLEELELQLPAAEEHSDSFSAVSL